MADGRRHSCNATNQVRTVVTMRCMRKGPSDNTINRGMGGNQAMRDAATALPILVGLASQASSGQHLSTQSIKEACKEYEDEMIPRAFSWVRKSGGSNLMVRSYNKAARRKPPSLTNLLTACRLKHFNRTLVLRSCWCCTAGCCSLVQVVCSIGRRDTCG